MATAERSWRDLVTPAMKARTREFFDELAARHTDFPADVTAMELGALSAAKRSDPDATIWDIVGPRRDQGALAIHLTGKAVRHHAVDSSAFTAFVARMTDAVNLTATDILKVATHTSRMQLAAIRPGSLEFELRAPDGPPPAEGQEEADLLGGSNADSEALRKVSLVLAHSNADDDVLASSVSVIPRSARAKLRAAMTQVSNQDWTLDGTLRQADFAPVALDVTTDGISRIREALAEATAPSIETKTVHGEISGFRREENIVWIATTTGRIPASPEAVDVMRAVREAAAVEGTFVKATLRVETRPSKRNPATLITRRTLTALHVVSQAPPLPDVDATSR